MRTTFLTASLVSLFCLIPSAQAENWLQWRGPALNGSTTETGLPDKLDLEKNLLWKVEMPGHGSGTPIVYENRVFVSSLDSQSQKLLAICLDNKTGKEIWRREVNEGIPSNARNDAAGPSPLTDGKTVWFYFGSGDLAAFDMDGKPLWSRNIAKDYGPFHVSWIYCSSPLLHFGKLYIQVIHRDVPLGRSRGPGEKPGPAESYLLALDPATGKDIFKQTRPSSAKGESQESYATPMPHEGDGRKEIIIAGGDCVTGHDSETGKELWRLGGWNPQAIANWRVVPTVVISGGKAIFCTPQAESRIIALNLGGSGDISKTHKAWENIQAKSDVPSPALYQGNLYVLDGDVRKGVTCLDPNTGQNKWFTPIRSRPVFRASPTAADGKIYVMNEESQIWILSAKTGKSLSTITLETEGTTRSTIVAAQGKLFVRTGNILYCFGQK